MVSNIVQQETKPVKTPASYRFWFRRANFPFRKQAMPFSQHLNFFFILKKNENMQVTT